MSVSKYRNVRTEIDGRRFDSKKEAARFCALRLLEQAGEIRDLVLQPKYRLEANGVLICVYKADFEYTDAATGERVTEDVKGVRTDVYKLKKKLVSALLGIEIREV